MMENQILWNYINMRESYLSNSAAVASISTKQKDIIDKLDSLIMEELNKINPTTIQQ